MKESPVAGPHTCAEQATKGFNWQMTWMFNFHNLWTKLRGQGRDSPPPRWRPSATGSVRGPYGTDITSAFPIQTTRNSDTRFCIQRYRMCSNPVLHARNNVKVSSAYCIVSLKAKHLTNHLRPYAITHGNHCDKVPQTSGTLMLIKQRWLR